MSTIEKIKNKLRKKAIVFNTGGMRPTKELGESWIGRVGWKLPEENLPTNGQGEKLSPLSTFFLEGLSYVPIELEGMKLITIFINEDVYDNLADGDLRDYFEIRVYNTLENIEPCDYESTIIKPFPLKPELKQDDFPVWDGGGIPEDIEDQIIELEESESIEYYDDIVEGFYAQHKIGGYPSFCQSGYWPGEGYSFVMQISSDSKAMFNIVDSGSFYFFYNPENADWVVYCDFY